MAADQKFHFSPRPNRAHEIEWREWGEDAFEAARESGKPILLALSAVWCHWCHVMDETSYSDDGVIRYINQHYVPVRVDNDQRPDINARYNMGGWPTTAFLTPDGEILAGATYVPPDQMLELLPKVNTYYLGNRDEVNEKVTDLLERRTIASRSEPGALSPDIYEAVLKHAIDSYDPVYGGFGDAPKFPHSDAIDLFLYAYRRDRDPDVLHMARKTLEFMYRSPTYDQEWDGFFRYATRRDWSDPHYEKMLEDNANLLHGLLALYRTTGDEEHAEAARRTIRYLEWKLRDHERGYFYGSQDADERFYELSAAGREMQEEPYIDRTCYTSWNAMMVSAYLEASWTLEAFEGRDGAPIDTRAAGLAALEFLWNECHEPGTGMYRFHDGVPQVQGLLGDQAYTARALLDAHEATIEPRYLERAQELAGFLLGRFADADNGGFFDVWDETEGLGRLKDRQKSVQDNTVCAEVFLRLGHLLREETHIATARRTLEAFAAVWPHMGYFASGYARWADTALNGPAEVNIVGDATSARELHTAALRLDVPARVVQLLDPARDGARIEAFGLPAEPVPAAYSCFGTTCSAPVTGPEGLLEAVRGMRSSRARAKL